MSKVILIIYGIIKKVNKQKNVHAVIFFQYKTNTYTEMNKLNNSVDEEYGAEVFVGNQSLFFFLGQNDSKISSVYWVSKEKMFFSKSFNDFVTTAKRKFDYKTFSPFEMIEMMKHFHFYIPIYFNVGIELVFQ